MCSLLQQTSPESLQVSDGGPSVDLDQILKKPPRTPHGHGTGGKERVEKTCKSQLSPLTPCHLFQINPFGLGAEQPR